MNFLSICSGIEAASVAFTPLGWKALAFAEIEPFPCEVLKHHYPETPNLGDLTQWRSWSPELLAQTDILVGGPPCQGFSLSGLRLSLEDERSQLTLTYCLLYDHIDLLRQSAGRHPAVCFYENVPGILSTQDNAFGCLLAGLAGEDVPLQPAGGKWTDAGCVHGPKRTVAWRVLDAQYFGLAQRRRRVFVVASADPGFDPTQVLFEWDSVRRDSPPSREAGQSIAHDAAPCLTRSGRGVERTGDVRGQDPVVAVASETRAGFWTDDGLARLRVPSAPTQPQNIVAFGGNNRSGPIDVSSVLQSRNPTAVAYAIQERAVCENPLAGPDGMGVRSDDCAYTLEARQISQAVVAQSTAWRVRRLTPEECELLQGFPVGYTLLPSKGGRRRDGADTTETVEYLVGLGFSRGEALEAVHSPDGPRYKSLGNSWAVPCAAWIGRRIQAHLNSGTDWM